MEIKNGKSNIIVWADAKYISLHYGINGHLLRRLILGKELNPSRLYKKYIFSLQEVERVLQNHQIYGNEKE